MARVDLAGQRFGILTALGPTASRRSIETAAESYPSVRATAAQRHALARAVS